MDKIELTERIKNTSRLLYQNREHEGLESVAKLLSEFQNMIQQLTDEQLKSGGQFALLMMKELLDGYHSQDMLGMADCLMEKSLLFVQFIIETSR